MENKNRNVWIIVAVVAVLLCFCALLAAIAVALGAGLFTALPVVREGGVGRVTERSEQVYSVGQAPLLELDNFAGEVIVRRGESERMRVIVTKRAFDSEALDRVDVTLEQRDDGLRIRTSRPSSLTANQSIDFEVFVPADAQLALETGAGNIRVEGVEGVIRADTGAGNIEVQGAVASVDLDTGAGNIEYEGEPSLGCAFDTGAGNITLHLPADVDAEVNLSTGIGNIELGGFPVQGDTSGTDIQGIIGSGDQATIEARTGVGNIRLVRR